MFDVKIACFRTDTGAHIRWCIGTPGSLDDNVAVIGNRDGWLSKTIKMNKDELYWVLGATKRKNTMINARTLHYITGGQRFVVIDAGVPEDNTMTVSGRGVALTAVRDPLLAKCGITACSTCPIRKGPVLDIEHECILHRIDYAIKSYK